MGGVEFAAWRVGIGLLNAVQRGLAFEDLALAEAIDPDEDLADEIDEAAHRDEAEAAPAVVVPAAVEARSEPDLLSKVGRGRIANFGCPHCGACEIGAWGKANGGPRRRCKECRKTFNALTGTPLAGLRYEGRWVDQAQASIGGESVAKAAERCAIDHTTAFRWRHRFLSALKLDKPTSLSGIVEADETFILQSFESPKLR